MPSKTLPSPQLITTSAQLAQVVDNLRQESHLGLDTEANSLYAYRERICLIQLSSRTADYLIDPLTVDEMAPLGELTADPAIEIVFHAAEYDLIGLKRDYGFTFTGLFDTMFAARLLGFEKFGLASLLHDWFNVEQDKRFQRADWSQRPLSDEQIQYAQTDTHYLIDLRDRLYAQLEERNALEEAYELFAQVANTHPQTQTFDPEGYWSFSAARRFSPRQMACLRELYLWRESVAAQRNTPPFKVFTNDTLAHIVEANPHSLKDLEYKLHIKPRLVRRYGQALLAALSKGRKTPPPNRPRHERLDAKILERHDCLKQWRKYRAEQRGVESDIVLPRDALWMIAKHPPRTLQELQNITSLGPWRMAAYGEEILQVLRDYEEKQ